jgi:hypothetical protein
MRSQPATSRTTSERFIGFMVCPRCDSLPLANRVWTNSQASTAPYQGGLFHSSVVVCGLTRI